MAAGLVTADIMMIQKNSQILVTVEEALEDLLVVTYSAEDKKFQGVLLDSNKSNLPFGVYGLNPAFTKTESADEKLHSVSQRFTYQEPQYVEEDHKVKKPGTKGKSQSRQKMTVRLRPRKVLCSNCQGICNENSENVDVSKKRKLDSDDDTPPPTSESSKLEKKFSNNMKSMLIPKLSRLQPSEISSAIKSTKVNQKNSEKAKNSKAEKVFEPVKTQEVAFVSVSDNNDSMCDSKNEEASFSNLFSSARTLKICFGEGEGTVVKIPPLSGDFNEDSGVSCDMAKPDSKAVKKALKRAKKQAKKSAVQCNTDVLSNQSLKHIGALSPHNNLSQSPLSDPLEKKHKHKVKHKKKHRVTRELDENSTKSEDNEYFSDLKDHCYKQKVSINLRRLSSNSFECREDDSDDCENETVPDFPPNSEGIGGRLVRVSPGDIVWGKVVGFPWWPGKVLSITATSRAHVAWFASTTSSLMPCNSLSPFLEDYKLRFNKKKRGAYKEAVKQATIEAKIRSESQDPLASPNHTLDTVSPRPIDVFS
ncbi:unnamed protein product [Leptosia nina]|uniref:PWWP domain-containing protein n=1 Tax=Leptosia nina TaxID=320188 RepID=A0AAV1K0Z2_9NEOP